MPIQHLTAGVFVSRVLPLLFFSVAMVLAVVPACVSTGMKSSGSASGDYLSFTVGEGVTQYFIRPLAFDRKDEQGEIDFTFREGQGAQTMDTVTANFTIVSTAIRKTVTSMQIRTDSTTATSFSVSTLYTEAKGDEVTARYSAKLPRQAFYRLFHEPVWTLLITGPTGSMTYQFTSSSKGTVTQLYRDLIRVAEAP